MLCKVLRSSKKDYTYLYLPLAGKFEDLPESLRAGFGEPTPVMQLNLDKVPRLAHADLDTVRNCLERDGYYLQLPPEEPVEREIERKLGL